MSSRVNGWLANLTETKRAILVIRKSTLLALCHEVGEDDPLFYWRSLRERVSEWARPSFLLVPSHKCSFLFFLFDTAPKVFLVKKGASSNIRPSGQGFLVASASAWDDYYSASSMLSLSISLAHTLLLRIVLTYVWILYSEFWKSSDNENETDESTLYVYTRIIVDLVNYYIWRLTTRVTHTKIRRLVYFPNSKSKKESERTKISRLHVVIGHLVRTSPQLLPLLISRERERDGWKGAWVC